MHNVYHRITQLVFLCLFVFCSSALAQGGSTLFNCLTSDSVQPPAAPAGQRTLSPVAIYACSETLPPNEELLPSWYDSIWTPTIPHSVPKFYKDNSLGKYIMNSAAFGRNSTHCFTFKGSGDGASLFEKWFGDVIPQADIVINFADFDKDGPNGVPDGVVDGLFFMVVNHTGWDGQAYKLGYFDVGEYKTNDINLNGDTIIIDPRLVVAVKAESRERAVALASHEWGHPLGRKDLYGGGWNGRRQLRLEADAGGYGAIAQPLVLEHTLSVRRCGNFI